MEKVKAGAEQLVEALTKRERAILAHLLAEKSNAEIAESETLAAETVKWYVKQIYAKLGVNKREEVPGRARELGLLRPQPGEAGPRPKHNLPAQLTSFIGREKAIAELRLLLRKKETRLVTLTGSGGTGKTRLALQTAAGLVELFADGVWQVELAPLADPELVPQTVLLALGQVEQQGKTPTAQLSDYLREKYLLLILDNCEHLVEACAKLAHALLQAAPGLKILASSREILGVIGEVPYRIPPLSIPDALQTKNLGEIGAYEAVRLFVERARVVNPSFILSAENASAVARITQRLDGIPLAIELAAARLSVLSVEQIAERLHDAFRLLTGGSRTALPRHQTLAALIDWSYNLLTEEERRGLRALSVFAGSWTLEAAEAVCTGEIDAVNLLGQLADKSLIFTNPGAGDEMRYRMLETIRQYTHTRLVEAGEAGKARGLHLMYYLDFAERLEPKLRGWEQIATLDTIESELDNLRLALDWGLQADVEAELRLASALKWFWHIRYHWTEGIAWLEQGLEAEKRKREDPNVLRRDTLVSAKAQSVLGFHLSQSDFDLSEKSRQYLEESKRIYESSVTGDRSGLGWALLYLGFGAWNAGDWEQGRRLAEEARNLFRECGEPFGMAECLQLLGDCEANVTQRLKYFQEQLSIVKAIGDSDGIATAFGHVAGIGFWTGEYSDAIGGFIASREHYRAVENPHMVAMQTQMIGFLFHLNGDLEQASRELEEAHDRLRELGLESEVNFNLYWRYFLALANGQYDLAERLTETLDRNVQMAGNPVWVTNVLYQRARLSRLRGEFGTAQRYAEEGLVTGQGLGYPRMLILHELGLLGLRENDFKKSKALFFSSLQALIESGDFHWLGWCNDGLALLAAKEGKLERTARLFGAKLWVGFANSLSPSERAERDVIFAELRAGLGAERFEQLREEGQALNFTEVLALAQEE